MTGKKILTMALGGLMALNAAAMAVPVMTATAEAAIHHQDRNAHQSRDYERALRAEHERHERKVREIRHKYRAHEHRHKMQRELTKESEHHKAKIKEIHRHYRHHSEHNGNARHKNHR